MDDQPNLRYIKMWMQFYIDHPDKPCTQDILQEWIEFCESNCNKIEKLQTELDNLKVSIHL